MLVETAAGHGDEGDVLHAAANVCNGLVVRSFFSLSVSHGKNVVSGWGRT